MTTLRLLVAGFLAGCGLVALTPSASYACSCAPGTPSDYVEWSDTVFVGTLTDIEPPPQRELMSSTDPNTFTFDVDRVLDGEVDATVQVESAMSGASCGWEGMKVGEEYVVFTDGGHGSLCGGTRPSSTAFVEKVERVTGPSEPVAPDVRALVATILAVFGFLS